MSDTSLGTGRVIAGVIGGIILGVWLSPAPVPETKFVKVEVPMVITEEAEEVEPEVKVVTETVYEDLPESCENVVANPQKIANLANRIHNRGKEIFARADAVDGESLVAGGAGTRFERWVVSMNGHNSDDLGQLFELVIDLDDTLESCKADIEASRNND